MEVLEQGRDESVDSATCRPLRVAVAALVAACLLVSAAVAGYRWWAEQELRPDALAISAVEVVGGATMTVIDGESGWPGGLGTPDGAVAPAVRLRLTIDGDPQRRIRVSPAPAGPGVLVAGDSSAVVPAGQTLVMEVRVSPSDCMTAGSAVRELLVTADGTPVPVADRVGAQVADLMSGLCTSGGPPPLLEPQSALVDVSFSDRTLVFTAEVSTEADRVVLTPLDGTALRGLGAQDVVTDTERQSVRLRWLISSGEMSPNTSLTGRVQAYSIVQGTAYPWVIVMPAPRDLEVRTRVDDLMPLRNDGIDLAEAAPRPSD